MFLLIILWLPAVIICVMLGNRKDHPTLGWFMGLLLGWIGVIVMLCVSKTHEQEVRDVQRRLRIEAEAKGEIPPEGTPRPPTAPGTSLGQYRTS